VVTFAVDRWSLIGPSVSSSSREGQIKLKNGAKRTSATRCPNSCVFRPHAVLTQAGRFRHTEIGGDYDGAGWIRNHEA
jgi:hypothetical protein